MASKRVFYDPEMRQSDHGRRLYDYWRKVKKDTDSEEFMEFPDFFNWAMANGYTVGAKLFRYDAEDPFSPENCFWVSRSDCANGATSPPRDREWEQKWDETVNRIRVHYGIKPLHSSEV